MQEQPVIAVRGEIVLVVEPEIARLELTVRATVEARFRISQPDLAAVAAEPGQEPG